MSWLAIAAIAAAGVLVLAELAARAAGFHRPLLYERTEYGYQPVAGQRVRLFSNHTWYNRWGARGDELADRPDDGVLRILCVGDSITNGGVGTDQRDTYPELLAGLLRAHVPRVEVQNASAGGWALENEEGWLRAHGIRGSHYVILQVATHDMHQRMASGSIVGVKATFPERHPRLALVHAIGRFVLPRLGLAPDTRDPGIEPDEYGPEDIARARRVLSRIHDFVTAQGARLLVMHVAQPPGIEPDTEFTRNAKSELRAWAASRGVLLVETEQAMVDAGGRSLFKDAIHPNVQGNRVLARTAAAAMIPLLARHARAAAP
jgi:lysophospholipase L1-like esterase